MTNLPPAGDPPLIVVIGDIALDYTIEVDRMGARDEKVAVIKSQRTLGGTGANAAAQIVALGGRCELISTVGNDPAGSWLVQQAREAGIGVGGVRVVEGESTTATIVMSGPERTVYVDLGAGANITISGWDLLNSADLIYVSHAPGIVPELVARDLGSRLVLGLEHWMISDDFLEYCQDVLLVVTNEAGAHAVGALRKTPVLVTKGVLGVELRRSGRNVNSAPAVQVDAIDTTGAGDSFAGALCFSLAMGGPLETSMGFAVAAAGLSTRSKGAQSGLPSLDEVKALLS